MAIGCSLNPELCHQEGATFLVLGTVKTEAQKELLIAHNARRRCINKGLKGIRDRFQEDLRYRDAQLKADRTEAKCIEMDELAHKDFTCRPSPEEFERCKKTWSGIIR